MVAASTKNLPADSAESAGGILDAVLGRPRRLISVSTVAGPSERCRTAVPQRHPTAEASDHPTVAEPFLMLPQALQLRALLGVSGSLSFMASLD